MIVHKSLVASFFTIPLIYILTTNCQNHPNLQRFDVQYRALLDGDLICLHVSLWVNETKYIYCRRFNWIDMIGSFISDCINTITLDATADIWIARGESPQAGDARTFPMFYYAETSAGPSLLNSSGNNPKSFIMMYEVIVLSNCRKLTL